MCLSVMPSPDYPTKGNIAKSLRLFLTLIASFGFGQVTELTLDDVRNRAARSNSRRTAEIR
jgi:hypothetical protein